MIPKFFSSRAICNTISGAALFLSAFVSAQSITSPLRQVRFIENKGQITDTRGELVPGVFFKASAPGLNLYVTNKGLTYSFFRMKKRDHKEKEETFLPRVREYEWETVTLELKGASIKRENIEVQEEQQGAFSFFTARFPNGVMGVHEYGKLIIKSVYPGIDWVLYNTSAGGFKYDFILHEGSKNEDIILSYKSGSAAKLDPSGYLEIATKFGTIKEDKPFSYFTSGNSPVRSSFVLLSQMSNGNVITSEFGIKLEGRRVNQAAVIDPLLTWSTFFGGSGFEGSMATEVDASGNLFICGYTASNDFPHYDAGTYFQGTATVTSISFISKFSPSGVLLWSTNYAGTSHQDMAIDPSGSIFVTGSASGSLMPVQNNSTYFQATSAGTSDAYILKFDNLGNRIWATYFGGASQDQGRTVATDNAGNVFLSGTTTSTNFPLLNANTFFVSTYTNTSAFVAKFSNNGTLLWSTYYTGLNPTNISTDNSGNVLLTGNTYSNLITSNPGSGAYFQGTMNGQMDAAVVKFDNTGTLLWSTFFGGSSQEYGASICGDKNGKVVIMGTTASTNLPLQNAGGYFDNTLGGYGDIFLARFSAGGALEWSTYFGGNSQEMISTYDNIALDSCNNLYAAFEADSSGLPVLQACDAGFYDTQFDSAGYRDVFIARFDNSTQQTWGTYAGGIGMDFRSTLATDKSNNLYVTGEWVLFSSTLTPNYPIISPGSGGYVDSTHNGSDDVYIMKFGSAGVAQPFSYPGPLCNSSTVSVAPLSITPAGGVFSSAPGLSVNPSTGAVYPASSAPGIYTVTYSGTQSICSCPQGTFNSMSTATIQLLGSPTLAVAGSNTPCPGQVATRTVSGAMTYTWSNGFQATILSIKPSTTTVLTITGTAQNGCSSVYTLTIHVKPCAGLDEASLGGVRVYPNPNSGSFTIESQQPAELILTNLLGQQVRNISVGKEEQRVEIRELPKGVYILKDVLHSSGAGMRIVVE